MQPVKNREMVRFGTYNVSHQLGYTKTWWRMMCFVTDKHLCGWNILQPALSNNCTVQLCASLKNNLPLCGSYSSSCNIVQSCSMCCNWQRPSQSKHLTLVSTATCLHNKYPVMLYQACRSHSACPQHKVRIQVQAHIQHTHACIPRSTKEGWSHCGTPFGKCGSHTSGHAHNVSHRSVPLPQSISSEMSITKARTTTHDYWKCPWYYYSTFTVSVLRHAQLTSCSPKQILGEKSWKGGTSQ